LVRSEVPVETELRLMLLVSEGHR